MGPLGVVIPNPGRDQMAGMGEALEQRLVEEFVPLAARHGPRGRVIAALRADDGFP